MLSVKEKDASRINNGEGMASERKELAFISVSIWLLTLSIVDSLDLLSLRRSSLHWMSSFFFKSRLDVSALALDKSRRQVQPLAFCELEAQTIEHKLVVV
jgi:hypothetical protein